MPRMTSEVSSPSSMTPQHVTATCVLILTLLVSVGVVTYLGSVVRPVLIAVFLYFIIQPAATWLTRRGLPSWVAYLALSLLLLTIIAGLVRVSYHSVQEFQAKLPRYREQLSERLASVPGFHPEQFEGRSLLELLQIETGDIVTYAFGTAMHVSEVMLLVFFYLVLVILDAHRLPARIHRAFPESSGHIMRAIEGINTGITGYMGVKTLVSIGMSVTAAVIMIGMGIDNWALWTLLTFLLNYITYVGSLAALVPPIVVAFLQFPSPWVAIITASLLGVNRFVWIDYVEIRYAGRALSINAVLLLASLMYWGTFWGIPGLVLAVPMVTAAKIVLANFSTTRRWALLISED
jgi:predicted PurR-regulated permease PerM